MNNSILRKYEVEFENPKIYVKSPGRANIIGEHTDYNKGLVMPFAIEHCIHMYIGNNQLGLLRIFAYDLNEYVEVNLNQLSFENNGWQRYFVNALCAMKYNKPQGIDIVFGGDLPQGGGVSSSSAITCGFIAGINSIFNFKLSTDEMIHLASQAENGIGLNGGIMDQTIIFKGKKDCALMIDFLDFTTQEIHLPPDEYTFYLFNSGQKHNLVETEYNKRRSTCEKSLSLLQNIDPKINSLRDVDVKDIRAKLEDNNMFKRCKHVIEENQRVQKVAGILQDKEYDLLGQLLLESHESLSSNYEVSTPEIDFLVHRSQSISNMLGSRIMGGGFGGCTINFVKGKLKESEIINIKEDYKAKSGLDLKVIEVRAGDGVEVTLHNSI